MDLKFDRFELTFVDVKTLLLKVCDIDSVSSFRHGAPSILHAFIEILEALEVIVEFVEACQFPAHIDSKQKRLFFELFRQFNTQDD